MQGTYRRNSVLAALPFGLLLVASASSQAQDRVYNPNGTLTDGSVGPSLAALGLFSAYFGGALLYSFLDVGNVAVRSASTVRFFQDGLCVGGEASAGFVNYTATRKQQSFAIR